MAPRPALRAHLSLFVVVIILLACSATGMLAGAFAHTLANKQAFGAPSNGPVISGTSPRGALATATSLPIATNSPPAASTATNFLLNIMLSSKSLSTGETFTVTVIATASGAPVAGLPCTLRSPLNGPPGLFSTWPSPAITDANGRATWTLTVPSVAPGSYAIEVDAIGGRSYEFHRYVSLQVA